jgi:hypothetical protein
VFLKTKSQRKSNGEKRIEEKNFAERALSKLKRKLLGTRETTEVDPPLEGS